MLPPGSETRSGHHPLASLNWGRWSGWGDLVGGSAYCLIISQLDSWLPDSSPNSQEGRIRETTSEKEKGRKKTYSQNWAPLKDCFQGVGLALRGPHPGQKTDRPCHCSGSLSLHGPTVCAHPEKAKWPSQPAPPLALPACRASCRSTLNVLFMEFSWSLPESALPLQKLRHSLF